MKRITWIKIHLYLSAIAAPFLLIMAFTGTSYLFNLKGSEEVKIVKTIQLSKADLTKENIAIELNEIDENYSFDYVKNLGDGAITRPTTRDYYKFTVKESGTEVSHVSPNLLRRLIEVHKGHGSQFIRNYEKAVGVFLLLIILTGLYLAFTMKREAKITAILFVLGTLIFFFM